MLPVLGRWCRPYSVHFAAVGTTFYTKARVNAACFSPVGVGAMLPILMLLMTPFALRRGKMLPVFRPLVVGALLPISVLLVPPFTVRRG